MRRRLITLVAVSLLAAVLTAPGLLSPGIARADSWSQVGSGGLAADFNPIQAAPESMCVYNSALYVGTSNQGSPGQVWCYSGSAWAMVGAPGLGNSRNFSIDSMAVYGGNLYAGTTNADGAQVWRYNGTAWTKVSSAANIEKATNESISAMAAGSSGLYAGTWNNSGCEVWRFNGSTWMICVGPGSGARGPGFDDATNRIVSSMTASATGNIYAGTYRSNGAEVWGGSFTTWTKWNVSGFGSADNDWVNTLTFYNNKLYAGTENYNVGCQVWAYDGPNPANWTQANTSGFGNPSNEAAECSVTFGSPSPGYLYVGVNNNLTGCKVMRYNGVGWVQANLNGFGSGTEVIYSMAASASTLYGGAFSNRGSVIYSTAGGATVPHAWTLRNSPGFTDNANEEATLAFFKGSLYAGISSGLGCQVWRREVSGWTRVATGGFGDYNNASVRAMVATGSYLYASTGNWTTGGEVWRYDGTTWTQLNVDGFGDASSDDISALVIFDSKLYAGSESYSTYGKVWRYDGPNPANWTQVNPAGFGTTTHIGVESLVVFGSRLYAGTQSSNDPCGVYRYNGGASWTQVSTNGFGDPNTTEVDSMAVYNGKLYESSYNRTMHGAEVRRYNGGTSWTPVNTNGFGDSDNSTPTQMVVFSGLLYVGTVNYAEGGQVWSYNGSSWSKANTNGMGKVYNREMVSLVTDGSGLYAGTGNYDEGCEVWYTAGKGNAWYLAEGSTAWGFSTYISVENANASAVQAKVTYMTDSGEVDGGTLDLPANSQTRVNPADLLGQRDFSTKVQSLDGSAICVDRTMAWPSGHDGKYAYHSSVGVNAPATTWYLPEGSSAWGFECWLLIQNPGSSAATCQVTYMIEGVGPQTFTKTVPAASRQSFNVAADIGAADASIQVVSDVPVIPERAMYKNSRREGHDSIGTTWPATGYYLAEGTSAWGFTTYVLVQNPNAFDAQVNITYMTPGGPVPHPENPINMPANSRKTIRVNDYLPDTDFSTRVQGSLPVIAERAMYWSPDASGEAMHDSIGMSQPHRYFYFPDGEANVDATWGRTETWTLVQNPNSSAVNIKVSYLPGGGGSPVTFTDTVPANSRVTYDMAAHMNNARASAVVECTSSGKQVICERAMYFQDRWGGTDTIGGYSD